MPPGCWQTRRSAAAASCVSQEHPRIPLSPPSIVPRPPAESRALKLLQNLVCIPSHALPHPLEVPTGNQGLDVRGGELECRGRGPWLRHNRGPVRPWSDSTPGRGALGSRRVPLHHHHVWHGGPRNVSVPVVDPTHVPHVMPLIGPELVLHGRREVVANVPKVPPLIPLLSMRKWRRLPFPHRDPAVVSAAHGTHHFTSHLRVVGYAPPLAPHVVIVRR
mmetsp:Transcript_26916/g.62368  ORF Transcript_26916/g.62368 Transcript_26916/m.62368 type:complete len:219 (+) Transcript_26916:101-757(+)